MNKIIILLCLIILIKLSQNSYQEWTPEASGYSKNNGYAGIFGKPITSIRVSGNKEYTVRLLGRGWLSPVTGNNIHDLDNGFSGIEGIEIDGIAIEGAKYRVHIMGEDWLDEVTEYDRNNPNCGISGKPIDAVMIKGRTYSTAYLFSNTNIINYGNGEVTQSTIVNCAKNQVKKYSLDDDTNEDSSSSYLAYYCHGKKIPKDIDGQYKGGIYIVNPQPGDLLFFKLGDNLHVGISIGGSMIIHQPNNTEIIQYTSYAEDANLASSYIGAKRYWNNL